MRRRHGHMPGVNAAMMRQSMRSDYQEIHALGKRLRTRLVAGSTLRVRAPAGTELTIAFSPHLAWCNQSGLLKDAGWTNLPGGEVLTSPMSVDGIIVPDGGMWDSSGTPVPNASRLSLHIESGYLVEARGRAGTDVDALLADFEAHDGARRVGQVALGTNVGVIALIGSLLQDLKMPGFHLSFGDTSPNLTGASWTSAVELPALVRRADVDVDGDAILRAGRYVARWLP